jgi:hypothetical protein
MPYGKQILGFFILGTSVTIPKKILSLLLKKIMNETHMTLHCQSIFG